MNCEHDWKYQCQLCGKCYICKHKAVFMNVEGVWKWKNSKGKFEPVPGTPGSFKDA